MRDNSETLVLMVIVLAAVFFAAGYFTAHEDLNAHNCQKFLQNDKFDRVGEELTNKYPNVPPIDKGGLISNFGNSIVSFFRNQKRKILYEENKNCSLGIKYYRVHFDNDNSLKHRKLCRSQWLKQAVGVGVEYAA